MTRQEIINARRRAMENRVSRDNDAAWDGNNTGLPDRALARLLGQALKPYGLRFTDDFGFIQADFKSPDPLPARDSVTLRQQYQKASPQDKTQEKGDFPFLLIAALAGGAYLLGSK
jgi:hypothetical protein